MRVSFMGTPDFAIPVLDAVEAAGHEICYVVTQPDRPKGRGHVLTPPPVKEWALKRDIKIFQPKRVSEIYDELKEYPVDVCVVAAFGQLLPQNVLDLPKYGCINVHASLLPKYRGAAPIQWAILNGDETTGVTVQQMALELDAGDVLCKIEIPISSEDTGGSLFDKLADLGGEAAVKTLEDIENGSLDPQPQDHSKASFVKKIDKSLGKLDFSRPAKELSDYVRGLNPWPGAYMDFNGKPLKIWKAVPETGANIASGDDKVYGESLIDDSGNWLVCAGDGYLCLKEVQLPGKKRMPAADFLRGHKIK